MNLEANVRLIVEEILAKMTADTASVRISHNLPLASTSLDCEPECLCDLGTRDLRQQLLVPEPINQDLYAQMKSETPARLGVWRAGCRPLTETILRFRADHAIAQDAVLSETPDEFIRENQLVGIRSLCKGKDEYLTRPDLGRKLDQQSLETIRRECQHNPQVQIIVGDGLSSKAIEANVPDLLSAFIQGLQTMGIRTGTTVFVKYARVAVMDVIGEELNAEMAIILIGERPGLGTAESMSAYMGYKPRRGMLESERSVISNIHQGGIPAPEAGAHLAGFVKKILDARASGVNLD